LRFPASSLATARLPQLPTAATRSGRLFRHRRRSPHSPRRSLRIPTSRRGDHWSPAGRAKHAPTVPTDTPVGANCVRPPEFHTHRRGRRPRRPVEFPKRPRKSVSSRGGFNRRGDLPVHSTFYQCIYKDCTSGPCRGRSFLVSARNEPKKPTQGGASSKGAPLAYPPAASPEVQIGIRIACRERPACRSSRLPYAS